MQRAPQFTYVAKSLEPDSLPVRRAIQSFCDAYAAKRFAKLFVSDNVLVIQNFVYGQGFFEDADSFVMSLHKKYRRTGSFLDVTASQGGCAVRSRRTGWPLKQETLGSHDPLEVAVGDTRFTILFARYPTTPMPFSYDTSSIYAVATVENHPPPDTAQKAVVKLARQFGVREFMLHIRGDTLFDGNHFPGPRLYGDDFDGLTVERYRAGWGMYCQYRNSRCDCALYRMKS
jgi:hypothetical protein